MDVIELLRGRCRSRMNRQRIEQLENFGAIRSPALRVSLIETSPATELLRYQQIANNAICVNP